MTRTLPALLLVIAVALAPPVFAQDTDYVLGEVVVESAKPDVEDVTNVSVVTAKDIETRGATTLNEAIEMIPGVYIRTAADGTPRIDIRGMRTRHIKLLINGTPYQSAYDGQFDPASIPAEIISRIVLTKGASSVLYGAGGTAGVMNIITKGGNQGMHGSVGLRAGETDSYLGKASLSGANEKGYFFGSVSRLNSNGYPVSGDFDKNEAQDSDRRKNSDRERNSFFFNGAYNIGANTELGGVLSYSGGAYGKPPSVITDETDPFGKTAEYERLEDYSDLAAQLNFRHKFETPLTVNFAIYANQRNELTKLYDDDSYSTMEDKGSFKSDSTNTVAGSNIRASYDFNDYGTLSLALSGESQSWDESGFIMVQEYDEKGKKVKGSYVKDNFSTKNDLQEYSTALEYTVTPIDPVTLVAGAGYVAQTGPESETATDWTYLVGATYRPVEGTAISASHARKVRFASIRNLFDVPSGNPDLEPEVSMHYEIGLDQALPYKTMFTAAVYRNDVKDLIEKDDTTKIYENYDKYLLQGFEVGLENRFFDSFWARVSYNYLHSEDRSDDADRDELQYRPRDTVAVEAEYTCPYGAALYASFYYAAHQYTYDGDDRKEMNDIALVNLKLSQPFLDNALKVYAGVNNLFDEDYEESYGFTRPGRTLYCGFDYAF